MSRRNAGNGTPAQRLEMATMKPHFETNMPIVQYISLSSNPYVFRMHRPVLNVTFIALEARTTTTEQSVLWIIVQGWNL